MKRPTPLRSTMLPWNPRDVLPPENPQRKLYSSKPAASLEEMPKVFTYALVDLVAEDIKLSKGKARKAILAGKVTVNETVVRDPDLRVDADARIVFKP